MKKAVKFKTKINTTAILAVLAFSAFIALFNETILNIALNILMNEMNVTAGKIQWLVTAYMIIVSVMVPVTTFLIQSFETKKLYLGAMTILLIGTICAAFSKTFAMLLVSRMLQASASGMMIPIMMNTVLLVTPAEKRGSAMGVCMCVIQLGPALGPTISGLILQFFTWHVLFIVLIPLIILAMIFGNIYLVNVSTLTKPKLDTISIILSTIGVGGIIYGLSSFSVDGNIKIAGIIFIFGIISLALFSKRQLSLKEPMLEMRTFKYPLFSICVVLVMISMMIIFTMNVMLPMFLEGSLKKATFASAMILLPATLTNGCVTLISGKIYDTIGAKTLIKIGFAVSTISLFILSRLPITIPIAVITITYIVVCAGVGCTMSPSQTNALTQLPKKYYPHGVAILNTLQQLAAAIGSSLFIGIMSASQQKALNNSVSTQTAVAAGFSAAVLALAGFVLVGFCLSFTLGFKNEKLSFNLSHKNTKNNRLS